MTTKILFKNKIRAEVLKVLSGYCFRERYSKHPYILILSPWISNVQLDIDKEVFELDELWFGWDYGIQSINIPYALLLLKMSFGAEITLVTLPPTERNYDQRTSYVHNLLDFLDEIGCEVFVNPNLHSKLILSNDLGLIGSFNLSKAALYDREEIGISIDDMSNLRVLEEYADGVIATSTPYGYTVRANRQRQDYDNKGIVVTKVTRGWLHEQIVRNFFNVIYDPTLFNEFLIDHIGTKSFYLNKVIQELASNLDAFYVKAVMKYLEPQYHISENEKLHYLKSILNYQGNHEIREILDFLKDKLARTHIPKIPLRIVSFQKQSPCDRY